MTPEMLAALFHTSITSTTLVSSLNESEETTAALAVSVAEAELAEVGDKPVSVHEAVDGFIVAGATHAILMGNDGTLRTASAKMEDANDTMIGAVAGRACSDDTFKNVTKDMLPSMEKSGDLNFIGYRDGKGNLVAMATNDLTSGKTHYFIPVPKNAKSKKPSMETVMKAVSKLKESLAQVNESEDASDTIRDHLTEAYMAIAGDINAPYDSDAPFSIYGNSINIRADAFIAKAPDYGVANYVLKLAVQEAMEKVGKMLSDAVFAALNGSAKAKALEIEVRKQKANESIDESVIEADAGTQDNPHGPEYDAAALREIISTAHEKLNPSLSTKLGPDDDATDYLGGSKNSERRAYYDARMALGQKLVRSDDGTTGKWVSDPGHFTGGGTGKGDALKEGVESIDEVESGNKAWGFHGTVKDIHAGAGSKNAEGEATKSYQHAHDHLVKTHKVSSEAAKHYLDSRMGRHLADRLTFHDVKTSADVKKHIGAAAEKHGVTTKDIAQIHKNWTESEMDNMDDGLTEADAVKYTASQKRAASSHAQAHAIKQLHSQFQKSHGRDATQAEVHQHVLSKKRSPVELAAYKKHLATGSVESDDSASTIFEKGDFVSKGGETHIVQNSTGDEITTAPVKINKECEKYDVVGVAVKSAPAELNLLGKSVTEAHAAIAAYNAARQRDDEAKLKTPEGEKARQARNAAAAAKLKAKNESVDEEKKGLFPGEGNGTVSPYAGKDDDGDEDSTGEDPDETVAVIVTGPEGLELRAGYDGEGELIASEKCDPNDDDEAKGAQGRLASKAQEQGFVYVPFNMKESYQHVENVLIPMVLKAQGKADIDLWTEAVEAAMLKDEPADVLAAAQAIAGLAETELLSGIVEGLTHRAHKRGRRPGLRTRFKMPTSKRPSGKTGPGHTGTMSHAETGKQGIRIHEGCTGEGCTHDAHEEEDVVVESLYGYGFSKEDAHDKAKELSLRHKSTYHVTNSKMAPKHSPHKTYGFRKEGEKGLSGSTHVASYRMGGKVNEDDAADGQTAAKTGVPGTGGTVKTGALKDAGPGTQGTFSTPAKGEKGLKVGVKESSAAATLAAKIAGRKVTEVDSNQKGAPEFNTGTIRKPKTPGPQNLIPRSDADAKTEAVAQEGTSKDQMSKQDACPNCENTHDITVGKGSVTCNNCGYKGTPADFQLPSSVGDMAEAWIQDARKMGLDEFVADITARAEKDSDAEFQARCVALREAYRSGPGKKDIARKVTAANPVVKKRIGKGISLEGLDSPAVAYTRICFPKGRVDEFLALALKAGSTGSEEVVVEDATIHIAMPADTAAKMKVLFSGVGIEYSPLA